MENSKTETSKGISGDRESLLHSSHCNRRRVHVSIHDKLKKMLMMKSKPYVIILY